MVKNLIVLLIACFFVFGLESPSEADVGKGKTLWAVSSPPKNFAEKSQKKTQKPISQDPAKPSKISRELEESIPAFDRDNPIAKGIILAFHRWPNEKEEALLLKKLTEAGLKKKSELKRFKTWIFEWSEWHKGEEAVQLCKQFSDLSFLDYCEPNFLLGPAQVSQEKGRSQNSGNSQISKQDESMRHFRSLLRESILTKSQKPKPEPSETPSSTRNVRNCNIVSSKLGLYPLPTEDGFKSQLSDYWGQERIGADLLKEELEKAPPVKKHLVAVFDSMLEKYNRHDIPVKNLISDKGRHSVLPEIGKYMSVSDVSLPELYLEESNAMLDGVENICRMIKPSFSESRTHLVRDSNPKPFTSVREVQKYSSIVADEDPYEQCRYTVLPSFINNSMYWGSGWNSGQSAYKAFNTISPPSIVVTAAGNLYPEPFSKYKSKASKDFDMIIVGNLSASGEKSHSSQEGLEVHIMAPGGSSLTSADEDGNYRRFGGTSGATPLVTGSLAGFEWLSGYHPTAEEAKILLEKTAILTKYSHDKPRKNGVGMLNAYKLGMVGKRMKERCGDDLYCFKNMIRKDSTYTFPEDKDLFKSVEQAFPECSPTCEGSMEPSCADKGAVFKSLRKASFLNLSNKKVWTSLACIYESGGFKKDALAMINTYKALFGPPGDGGEAHTVCQSDADCVLAPCPAPLPLDLLLKVRKNKIAEIMKRDDLSLKEKKDKIAEIMRKTDFPSQFDEPFSAMTKAEAEIQYATGPCRGTLCNGKCRCDDEETAIEQGSITYSSKCINSQCVLSSPYQQIPASVPSQEKKHTPSDSGQR